MINDVKIKYNSLSLPIKASIWFLICSFLQKGISVITTPIFTRILSVSEYGSYNVFTSWEGIFSVIFTMNLFYGMYTRGLVKFEEDRNRFTSSIAGLLSTMIFIWLLIYLIFYKIVNIYIGLPINYMILMFLWIWSSAVFQMWAAEQRVDYKYKKLVIISLVVSVCSPLLSIIFMTIFKDKVFARILGMVFVSIIAYTWMYIQQIKNGKCFFSKKYWIHALTFSIPLLPHYLSQTILNSSDRIMIEKMVNSETAGIYSLAYSISMIMILFNNALSQTISPWIYKKIKNNKIKDISKIAYSTLVIIAGVNLLLMLVAPEVIAFFAPKTYHDAIWIIPPVAMSVYFMYEYDLFAKFAFYFEKTKSIALVTMIGAILNIVLNYVFIKMFGYIAAGYTTLICYILYAMLHFILMRKVCREKCNDNQPYDIKIVLLISVSFIVLGFCILLLYNNIFLRYSIIIIIIIVSILKRNYILKKIKSILNIKKES